MSDMNIQYYKANDLIMAEYNPRQLTKDQYTQLKDSLTRFGLVDPLIVNKHKSRKNILVGGHQRLRIAKEIGMEKIPCVEVDLPLDLEKELNIRLNKNVGEWDYDSLANYFDVSELMEWGFSNDELQFYEEEPEQGLTDDDEIPEVEEAITKSGDIWLLGEHRLLCGDSTKKDDVERLMNGDKADLLLTDPPYGIDYGGMLKGKGDGKGGADKNGWKFYKAEWDKSKPEKGVLQHLCQITENQIIWGGNYFTDDLPPKMGWLIWDKGQRGFSLADGEMAWTSFDNALRIKEYSRAKANKENKEHPTQKPVEIINWCIEYSDRHTKKKPKNILDTYMGSGTTLIACEKTNRKCYGMELDTHYCDVIVKRWEEFTGNKAERVERAEC